MKKLLLVPVLTGALLAPALPAIAAPVAPVSATASTRATAQTQLAQLDEQIGALRAAQANQPPSSDYSQQLLDLLKTALELRGMITSIASGQLPAFDPATIGPRIELIAAVTSTIKTATTTLQDKVQPAHVELALATTKAVLRLVNLSATTAMLDDARQNLTAVLAKVSGYPDLTPGDTATVYVKARLDKEIWSVRVQRDKNILGKAPFAVCNELNRNITHAVGVWANPGATVAQVDGEIQALDAAYQKAAGSLA